MKKRHNGEIKPEWRLPLMLLSGFFAPVGLFIYDWTAQAHIQFVVPILGSSLIGCSLSATALLVITYIFDVFGQFRASALAAVFVYRQAVTIVLPLAGPPLYQKLGIGRGNWCLALLL